MSLFTPFAFVKQEIAAPTETLVFGVDFLDPACYPGSGTTVYDLATNQAGTIYNSPSYTGSSEGWFTFNGTSQYMDWTHDVSQVLPASQSFTFVAWASHNTTSDQVLLTKGPNTSQPSNYMGQYEFRTAGPSPVNRQNFMSTISGNSFWEAVSSTAVFDGSNSWRNSIVSVTFDAGTGKYLSSFYSNNTFISTYTPSAAGGLDFSGTEPLRIARAKRGSYWNGRIAVIKLYPYAFTAGDVSTYWNATKARFGL